MTQERQERIAAFLRENGHEHAEWQPLKGDASFRRYIRIRTQGKSFMLMDAPPGKEDVRPYVAIAGHLAAAGYSVPDILARDVEAGLLLLEDLGDGLFTALLKRNAMEQELYAAAVDVLAQWHSDAALAADRAALPLRAYDKALLLQEARLFADWFLPQVLNKGEAARRSEEYLGLWEEMLGDVPLATTHFVHRDYHADNLLWLPERAGARRVGLLDFQDGVYGDPAYDLVSLLEDARRDVPPDLADAMRARYLAATKADPARFLAAYAILGAQRNCKIIGIFTRLAARDNKFGYLKHLPRVWRHLEKDVAHAPLAPLKDWLDQVIAPEWRGAVPVTPLRVSA